ncbi:MAG TPA: rhombotarget lipoprotein [Steroidobacteraceae bacterium]|nr:rhombotarget lipoprotein [Steroidobacteraceae bacterium]
MNLTKMTALAMLGALLAGCAPIDRLLCAPACRSSSHNSSSLVSFLYGPGDALPAQDATPELHLPLRVGLAFLPSQHDGGANGLDAAHQQQILERIRARFADRKFVSEIVIVPDYYLASAHGFEGLKGVQRLYSIDLMALVSYDQVTHLDDNKRSLLYWTILGTYVVKGTTHDVSTLMDLAVVDPATRSLVLRAGGTDTRHEASTLLDAERDARTASGAGFDTAGAELVENFDGALTRFEESVRSGQANVRIVHRNDTGPTRSGGGGALDIDDVLALLVVAVLGSRSRALARSRRSVVTIASQSWLVRKL